MARLLKVEVDKVYLYPLGGISKFFLPLNSFFLKEFLILIAGPIFQCIAKHFLLLIFPTNEQLINLYHYGILLFNLLPIYPLDGGKLIHLVLSIFLPYKKSLSLTIIISYLMILLYFFINVPTLGINDIIITLFLTYKVVGEHRKVKYFYEKFLLERHLYNYAFKSSKLITNSQNFYKNKRHLIKENDRYYLEKDYLAKKYKKNQKSC